MSERTEQVGRIEWAQSPYGALEGRVNGLRMFTINYAVTKAEGERGDYVVRSSLPGYTKDRRAVGEAEGKALCERMLLGFVAKIGAEFKAGA